MASIFSCRLLLIVYFGVAPASVCFLPWQSIEAADEGGQGLHDDPKQREAGNSMADAPNWRKLLFSPDRKIERVHIRLLDMKTSPWGKSGIAGEAGLEFETTRPLILRTFEVGLDLPLTRGAPGNEDEFGAGSAYSVGEIKVSTTDDDFMIGITTGGFSLGSKEYSIQRVFYSWPLAKQIDDILFANTSRHLPQAAFEKLSGEWIVPAGKYRYYMLREPEKEEAPE